MSSLIQELKLRLSCLLCGVDIQKLRGPAPPWKIPPEVQRLLEQVGAFTLNDPLRLAMLHGLAREIGRNNLEGDVVECGVCKGGSAAIMASAIRASNRQLWLYDCFDGMPAPGPKDPAAAQAETGLLAVGVEPVKSILEKVQFPKNRILIRKGVFSETFKEPLPNKIALLHIDSDWYESVLSSLQTFYPLVVDGGWIALDDFGHWEGTRRAFYAFCQSQSVTPLLERNGYTQALWRKGSETNREIAGAYNLGIYRPQHQYDT